jgi:hypothetical protein
VNSAEAVAGGKEADGGGRLGRSQTERARHFLAQVTSGRDLDVWQFNDGRRNGEIDGRRVVLLNSKKAEGITQVSLGWSKLEDATLNTDAVTAPAKGTADTLSVIAKRNLPTRARSSASPDWRSSSRAASASVSAAPWRKFPTFQPTATTPYQSVCGCGLTPAWRSTRQPCSWRR